MTKLIDYEKLNPEGVLAEIRANIEAKGSLDITELANESVPQSPFLTALENAAGQSPFAFVMKSSYKEVISEVRVQSTPALLMAALPTEHQNMVKALALIIQQKEIKSSNAEFQAFKRLICHELTKSILVQSKGSVQLDWDEKFGTDVKFCHAHTDDDKKAQYEEQRQEREARTAGGTRIAGMRDKIKKYRR